MVYCPALIKINSPANVQNLSIFQYKVDGLAAREIMPF